MNLPKTRGVMLAVILAVAVGIPAGADAQQPIVIKFSHVVANDMIIKLTPEEKAAVKKALVTVHKENEGRIGKDIIAEVYQETGFKP